MTRLFDSHAHLDDQAFNEDRDAIFAECEKELTGVLNPGTELETSRKAVEFSASYAWLYAAVGFHPHEARLMRAGDEQKLADLAAGGKTVAIGEIGLDYYYDHSPREIQREVFIRQLDLARQLHLPVIIHDRDAHADTLAIIKANGRGLRGVFHCYAGDLAMAEELLRLDFYLAFGGGLTFKKADNTRAVARALPLERILLETDCPYLAPVPRRGKRNQPAFIKYVAEQLAGLRGIEQEKVALATVANTRELFAL